MYVLNDYFIHYPPLSQEQKAAQCIQLKAPTLIIQRLTRGHMELAFSEWFKTTQNNYKKNKYLCLRKSYQDCKATHSIAREKMMDDIEY